ncbi:MAG: FN3 associated domain-containing protein [Akkermansiaceae bacterium]
MKLSLQIFLVALATILPGHADLHITEFMVLNGGSLKDEDGDSSDWIELFNSGPDSVDLDGYFLTNDETALTKWTLPAIQLESGAFLLVFASEKNRRLPDSELHTNFKLANGDYLALIDPDGATVIVEFGSPADPLPPQFEDISYGLMQNGNRTPAVLLDAKPSGKALVPLNGSLGDSWQGLGFNDNTWSSLTAGVGYDESTTYNSHFGAGGDLDNALNNVNTSVYLRFPFPLDESNLISGLTLKMKYDDGFAAFLNGIRVAGANAPGALSWDTEASGQHSDAEAVTLIDFDISEHAHLLVDGPNILAIHGLNDSITSSDMLISPELHAIRVTDPTIGGPGFLGTPSPGGLNGDTFGGFVADTKFSVDRGIHDTAFNLEITSATPDAEIRYTLDGTPPDTNLGQVYSGPISITGTAIVRALAHKPGFRPTNIDTHTYIFPTDVVNQPRMRNAITGSATYGPQMIDSLKAVPTISLVTENTGFLNETAGNIRSEHQTSVEMMFPDGTPGFQEDGGLSNYGGRFTNFRKKSFRVAFRSQFGATKLKYPIFDGFEYENFPPADEFDVINLRSGSHDMASRGAYMSNRFTDDSMIEMGNIAPHGRFVHVYLNGNYWGQYHLRERWNADMAQSYYGGPESDYEAVNANDNFINDEEVYDGPGDFWAETKALIAGANPFANSQDHLDVANLIDFMLLWVSGNSESEFRSFGSRAQGVPFKFMIKDADGYLRAASAGKASHPGPRDVMTVMAGDPEFKTLLADRIHHHFFNDGALTPARNIARLQRRVDEARLGFISEGARWGDAFREPATWESYQTNLVNNHFPGLAQTMVSRFKSAGMYPDIIAPVFNQHGGSVSDDTPLTMSTDADKIYYTFDGSDPRLVGGAPNPAASEASFDDGGPGEQQPVTYMTTGHAWKYLDTGSNQGTAWRATAFNDAAWASGPSPLGYGGDGEATELSFGGDTQNKHATTYYRTTIEIPDPTVFLNFLLRVKYDDGAAVYINGVERFRQNIDNNAGFNDYANGTVSDEGGWKDITIPVTALVAGTNSIAVEVHQASGTSSDTRMDLTLRGQTTDVGGGGDNFTDPFILDQPTLIRARAYNSNSGEWSALNEAFFTIDAVPADATNLVISEFHYRPANPTTPAELAVTSDRDDFEFLEFLNIGDSDLDMNDVRFSSGINFSFPDNVVLGIGKRILLVRDRAAFEARYGPPSVQSFEYTGRLSNDGEQLLILGSGPDPVKDFTYNDQAPWPVNADGKGPTLVLIDATSNPDHTNPNNWIDSQNQGGSPGSGEPDGLNYDTWASSFDLQGAPLDDDDGDQLLNFFEFLHGSNPVDSSDAPIPVATVQALEVDGLTSDYLTLTFNKSFGTIGTLTVEISSDLQNWSGDSSLTKVVSDIDNGNGTSTMTVRLAAPISPEQDKIYLRLRGR